MGLQTIENKALSWGIIGKSAPTLAEIKIQKSQPLSFASNEDDTESDFTLCRNPSRATGNLADDG